MFSGIIETIGKVADVKKHENGNVTYVIEADFVQELKVDQSVAHNGVCLTVEKITHKGYEVTAIPETLQKSNLGALTQGALVNLERALKAGDRLDGHMVQGHVDTTAICDWYEETGGSWSYGFSYHSQEGHITVPKGSICVNGVSLTVVESRPGYFSVAIIPYTYAHTNFKVLTLGSSVNLEFDILGKYIKAYLDQIEVASSK